MKSLVAALIATSMFAAGPHGKPASAATACRSRIAHNLVLLTAATRKKDVAGIMALMDTKFTQRYLKGATYSYSELKPMLQGYFHTLTAITTCSSRLASFAFHGSTALTTVAEQSAGTINVPAGTPGVKRGLQPFSESSVSQIVWVKRGASWKALSSVILRAQTKISGKPIRSL